MARSYARLLVSLWTDSDFRALKASPQRLYMALLSNPKLSTAGCLPWQVNKWANLAADLTAQQVTDDLNALAAGRFILCDAITEEVLIRSFIRHDGGVRNPNLLKSIESAIVAIESPRLRATATAELAKAQRTDSEPGRTGGPGPGRTEGPEQAATEPTYIPHPSSLIPEPSSINPHPSSADELVNNSTPVDNSSIDDMDSMISRIITRCAAIRTDKKRPDNPTAYQAAIVADMQANERAAIAELLVAKPYMRTQHDKAAAWHELARTQNARTA